MAEQWTDKLAGKFLVLDGPDGAGKSTQVRLLGDHLRGLGMPVEVAIDPGTTRIGQKIRDVLLDRDNGEIGPMCETFLFMASRAQLVHELIRPALAQGKVVLCDRFVSATIAYQGASGVDTKMIMKLGEVAIDGLWPHLTIVLDIPTDAGFKRLGLRRARLKKPRAEEMEKLGIETRKDKKDPVVPSGQLRLFGDRLEQRSSGYHERVRRIFLDLRAYYPGPVCYVDATQTEKEVLSLMIEAIAREFGG